MRNVIYLDNAATTAVDKNVLKRMLPLFDNEYANASSSHSMGERVAAEIEATREKISHKINAKPKEIIFTSGGTESNNMALKGVMYANKKKGKHLVTTNIEHDSILQPAKQLEKEGFEVTYVNVDKEGCVDPLDVKNSIREDTVMVSVMHANNEIGSIQPIKEIGKICKEKNVYFHSDACQSFAKLPLDAQKMHLDLLTINAHKIHGPKGIGALYARRCVNPVPLLHGGGQEENKRSGTLNTPGIIGFGEAIDVIKESDIRHMTKLRDYLMDNLLQIENTQLNGPRQNRLCNNLNIGFKFIEGESIIMMLDKKGIYASTGSACSSKSLEPSHVLTGIGRKPEEAHGSVRFSLSKDNTKEQMDYVIEALNEIVPKLRKMSPVRW